MREKYLELEERGAAQVDEQQDQQDQLDRALQNATT